MRLAKAEKNEEVLLKECERHQKKSRGYRLREQEARLEKEKLEKQCDQLVEKVSKVEAEVEHKEAAKMRLLAKNLALQRDMKKLQEECVPCCVWTVLRLISVQERCPGGQVQRAQDGSGTIAQETEPEKQVASSLR